VSSEADPHVIVEGGGVVGEDVGGTVLEPEQVPWCRLRSRRLRGLAETQLRPAQARAAERDAAEVADRVDRDLRVVRARLDAEVAVRRLRYQVVAEEGGELREPRGEQRCQTVPVGAVLGREEGGAEPEGDGEAGCREPQRFAGVIRRRLG